MKKIAFFGTPDFTVEFLEALQAHGLTPALIVTNPDRAVGRGMALTSPFPKVWGDKHAVPVMQPEHIDEKVLETLARTKWDLFVVVAYGKILPQALISMPTLGTINIHYSLLPHYRGATPVESAILHGETVTGVCIQQMQLKLDSGPLLACESIPIAPDDTTLSLRHKLNTIALNLLPDIINKLFAGSITAIAQDENRASHTGKIKKTDGEITLSDDAATNDRKFRAHVGNVGTYFYTEKKGMRIRVKITKAHMENGIFIIDEVIPENGKRQPYEVFIKN